MKRTSLFLDEKLLRTLSRTAKQRQVSVASLIREAVGSYLAGAVGGSRLPTITGRFSSGRGDVAERNEELLWNEPHQ